MRIGDVFGRFTVLGLISDRKNPKALCKCECGQISTPQRGSLRNGRAQSCGCLKREKLLAATKKHGMSKSYEYHVFKGMKNRCFNSECKEYRNYGARGISVNYADFMEFYDDVGKCPRGAWIDRIDNNKSYEKGNCRWVMPSENQKNKRTSKNWIINGVVYESSREAAKALGKDTSAINRGCNGYFKHGKQYPPRPGWSCNFKY
jgi:hypothetical protein